MNTSIKAVAAVKELVYTGFCHLDNVMQSEEGLAEILDTMSALGIEASFNSFSLETEIQIPESWKSDNVEHSRLEQIWKEERKPEIKVQVRNPELKVKEEFCVEENVQSHTQNKNVFACYFEGCKAKLASRDSLNGHIRNIHKKTKPFECDQCLKKFKKRANLRRHTDAVHSKLKPYQCEEAGCSKTFSSKDWLKSHVKTFHLNERPFACHQPGCGEMFGLKIRLKRHMIKVHKFEKPHTCGEKNCGQQFGEGKQLRDHFRSVHGAEKLACDIGSCARTFNSFSGLYAHKKKHTQTNVSS